MKKKHIIFTFVTFTLLCVLYLFLRNNPKGFTSKQCQSDLLEYSCIGNCSDGFMTRVYFLKQDSNIANSEKHLVPSEELINVSILLHAVSRCNYCKNTYIKNGKDTITCDEYYKFHEKMKIQYKQELDSSWFGI